MLYVLYWKPIILIAQTDNCSQLRQFSMFVNCIVMHMDSTNNDHNEHILYTNLTIRFGHFNTSDLKLNTF